uniref:Uncharacterized protein n=1 Tax=Graphocephala atropunctata TaxID=36148 RepID=A0A1B6L420_9HEMI
MATELENEWSEITNDAGINYDKKQYWWSKIIQNYSSEGRQYHDIQSLDEKFKYFSSIKSQLKNPVAVAFALFFQYLEYNPKSIDYNKKNIELFTTFFSDCELGLESPLYSEVLSLLEAADTSSTEEHKTDGAIGSEDRHYFLDLDMVVLGSEPEQYIIYANKVKEEYHFLPQPVYNDLRVKVLQNFLQIPNIFATKEFREKYEAQARSNIQKEVDSLK